MAPQSLILRKTKMPERNRQTGMERLLYSLRGYQESKVPCIVCWKGQARGKENPRNYHISSIDEVAGKVELTPIIGGGEVVRVPLADITIIDTPNPPTPARYSGPQPS